jgi:hypothetical protein
MEPLGDLPGLEPVKCLKNLATFIFQKEGQELNNVNFIIRDEDGQRVAVLVVPR